MTADSRKLLSKLRRLIDQHFNLEEMQMICFDLDVDFEHLAGQTKPLRVHNLILLLVRNQRLPDLVELLEELRPTVVWPDLPAELELNNLGDGGAAEAGTVNQMSVGDVGAGAAVVGNVAAGASVNVQSYQFGGDISGDVNIAGDVHLTAELPIPKPPEPERPPDSSRLIGREDELIHFADTLRDAGLAVITGMAGIGKTALAAELARRTTDASLIFWHSFHEGEGVAAIIWRLAGFLARQGQDELWQLLQRAQLTKGVPPPTESLLDYLLASLQGKDYLLCLDDLHLVLDDPQMQLFVSRLRTVLQSGLLKIVITSRRIPSFITLVEVKPLTGISQPAMTDLLTQYGINLTASQLANLHMRTQGNAALLTLSLDKLQQTADINRFIDGLAEAVDVERFLMREIDDHLTNGERQVMEAIAALLRHPADRHAIGALLEGRNVRRTLRELSDRFLLIVRSTDEGEMYVQHALVQAYYYDGLSRQQRRQMHQAAGVYYRDEDRHVMRAARQFVQGEEYVAAADLIKGDLWELLNQGHSQSLFDLLERFSAASLSSESWLELQLVKGQVGAFLGQSEAAQSAYQSLLRQVENRPEDDWLREIRVRIYLGLGELLAQEDPQAALDWLQQGLNSVPEQSQLNKAEIAALHLKMGTIHFWLGNYDEAKPALERSLALLQDGISQAKARTLITLGCVIFEREQDFTRAFALMDEALTISVDMRDHFQTSGILTTRAGKRFQAGDWAQALADAKEALKIAEQLGSAKARLVAETNLGVTLTYIGDFNEAEHHLAAGLALSQQTSQRYSENATLLCLADCHIRQGNWDRAEIYLRQAEPLTQKLEDELSLPLLALGWSQVHAALGATAAAITAAEQAVKLNRDFADPVELGISLRILGQAYAADDQLEVADAAFAESKKLLGDQFPYEAAQTLLQWGRLQIARGQRDSGQALLEKAQRTFQRLGAKLELQMIKS